MYSEIITAEDYTDIMSQHIYMSTSDGLVANSVKYYANRIANGQPIKVLDIGCGPGRITRLLVNDPQFEIAGVDIDTAFLKYAKRIISGVQFIEADLLNYKHPDIVDIIVSHGLDHHIAPVYLKQLQTYLKPGGIYVLGDEFLPYYKDMEERKIRAIIWYAHVISHALKNNHSRLALEEAKTLLDDLAYDDTTQIKTQHQINLVLEQVKIMDKACETKNWRKANLLAVDLLQDLQITQQSTKVDTNLTLSRGDYKVCHSEFVKKIEQYGFQIIGIQTIGSIHTIGGFTVYVLKKNK